MSRPRLLRTLANRRVQAVAAGVVLIVSGIILSLGIRIAIDIMRSSGREPASLAPAGRAHFGVAPRDLCYEGEPPAVGLLGRLAPGATPASLQGSGYDATRAIEGAEDDLVVINPASGPFAASEEALDQLEKHPALSRVGLVRAQSEDPSLRSCEQRLRDRPGAQEIGNRTAAWMVTNSILTQEQIDAGGTTFQLAEDPTNPAHLFFTVLLAKPGGGIPGSPDAASLTSYVATIDKESGNVLSAGRAHW